MERTNGFSLNRIERLNFLEDAIGSHTELWVIEAGVGRGAVPPFLGFHGKERFFGRRFWFFFGGHDFGLGPVHGNCVSDLQWRACLEMLYVGV